MTNAVLKLVQSKFEREFNPNETLKVLTINQPIYWSWGVSNKMNFSNKALLLKVNAHRHKSYVLITLAWDDTYSVYLVTNRGTIKKEFKGVYFDMLTQTIDDEIERIAEYTI